jgi:DNA sulfur modification protein DndB
MLADMLPGKTIPSLSIRVPAVRTKMGGAFCYTFSISPEYLLKISYVSHRKKGKASDINTYNRMLTKKRLSDIGQYITDNGIFPTNIVINIEKKRLDFQRVHQETDKDRDPDSGLLGWLDIKPAYKSAWIIDGQHRLYAFSGHERSSKSLLSVLAFEGLAPSMQAQLFVDINAKQKSVKTSLLQELYAELHWDSEKVEERIRAIVSKAIQDLDMDPQSPLFHRIQKADSVQDDICCISLSSIFGAIDKSEFYIVKEKHGHILEYGPLWAGDNYKTLERTIFVLKNWLDVISSRAKDWWEKGKGEGGGLAMNDGIVTCTNLLRSVFHHIDSTGKKIVHLDDEDLFECVKNYAEIIGNYFSSLSEQERKIFRDLRGIQGQTTRRRRCEKAINEQNPSFNPPGLEKFLAEEKAETNLRGREIIDRMEVNLQKVILDELKREFGPNENQWWMLGVPKQVGIRATNDYEKDNGSRGGKECYFNLIDYRDIAVQNWGIFDNILAYGKSGNKGKRTSWMVFINDKRNIVSHKSSGVTLSIEDLNQLQEYDRFLSEKIFGL